LGSTLSAWLCRFREPGVGCRAGVSSGDTRPSKVAKSGLWTSESAGETCQLGCCDTQTECGEPHCCLLACIVTMERKKTKGKEHFMLFGNHITDDSLLIRQQPGAMTTGHCPIDNGELD